MKELVIKYSGKLLNLLSDKSLHKMHGNENYSPLKNGQHIQDNKGISKIFNDNFINIIENMTDRKQEVSLFSSLNHEI